MRKEPFGWWVETDCADGGKTGQFVRDWSFIETLQSHIPTTAVTALYTSPAHTLEARDAARYRWIREKTTHEDWDGYSLPHVCDIDFKPGSQLNEMHETLDAAIDAAMRQEGGSDERS